ncbi:hypothetical protein HGA34_01005 [Candidatus Falkowbacteria bacterium]|nr:hypothetical protein [Candidatus Falkowbacteria bacterium]
MLKKIVTANDAKNLNLLTLAGLAIKADGTIETLTLDANNLTDSVAIVAAPKNATIITAIHTCRDGVMLKIQGTMSRDVKQIASDLIAMMRKQKLDESLFPGYASASDTDIYVGNNKLDMVQAPSLVADATLYNDMVYCVKKLDQNRLFSIPLATMRTERNWVSKAVPAASFTHKITAIGRISAKNETLVISLANTKAATFCFKTGSYETVTTTQVGQYLGNFKLSSTIDHAIDVFVAGAKMIFAPAANPAAAQI